MVFQCNLFGEPINFPKFSIILDKEEIVHINHALNFYAGRN